MNDAKGFLLLAVLGVLVSGCVSLHNDKTYQKHPQVARMQLAIEQYQDLTAVSWPQIKAVSRLKLGKKNPDTALIKQRLMYLGDWPSFCSKKPTPLFDDCLQEGLKRFQERHGLHSDGIVGRQTLTELNRTPQQRMEELNKGIKLWRQLPNQASPPYLLINIPSYELQAINQGQTELHMRVIVGEPSWPTPNLDSKITTVVINPNWNVPINITEKELIRKIVDDPSYLTDHHIRIVENWSVNAKQIDPSTIDWKDYLGPKDLPYRLVQQPGEENALGKIKFIFPNKDSIYLHDTPIKSLFKKDFRALSHGCIRLQRPMELLSYLSQSNPSLAKDKIERYLNSNNTKYLRLNKKMPLYITYITSWVSNDGRVQFRPDVYRKLSTSL